MALANRNNRKRMNRDPFQVAAKLICFGLIVCSCGCNLIQTTGEEKPAVMTAPEEIQFGVARMMERSGSISAAEKVYRNILETNPDHSEAQHRLGVVLLRSEQLDQAIEQLAIAATVSDPTADLLGDLGYAHMLKGDLEKSENYLRTAVEQSADDQRLVNNLGMVVGFQGRDEESLQLFRRVNSESESQSNLAYVLAARGERDAAKERYHVALEREPKLKQAARGLSEFYRDPLHARHLSQQPAAK